MLKRKKQEVLRDAITTGSEQAGDLLAMSDSVGESATAAVAALPGTPVTRSDRALVPDTRDNNAYMDL